MSCTLPNKYDKLEEFNEKCAKLESQVTIRFGFVA